MLSHKIRRLKASGGASGWFYSMYKIKKCQEQKQQSKIGSGACDYETKKSYSLRGRRRTLHRGHSE